MKDKIKAGHILLLIGILLIVFGVYRINAATDDFEIEYLTKAFKNLIFIPILLIIIGFKQLNK